MLIGQRLKEIREAKNLSQADIADATGFVRSYISRIEHGRSVPSVETLEIWAHALGMPLYQLMSEGEEPPKPLKLSRQNDETLWGNSGREAAELNRLRQSLAKMDEGDRKTLLALAGQMARSARLK